MCIITWVHLQLHIYLYTFMPYDYLYFFSIICFKIGAWNGYMGRVNIAFRSRSLDEGIVPTGLHLNKKPSICTGFGER